MGNIFSGSEIVEMGVQIEKNGRDFYLALCGSSKSQKAKEAFKFLAGEEERHIAVFSRLLDSVEKYEPQEAYPGEYFAYMRALAGDYVFTRRDEGGREAKKVKSDKEAIETGIGFEKESILFYEGMKRVVPDRDRGIIEEIVSQEQSHLRQLSELRGAI